MKYVDLNCDMGESFGSYKLGYDEEVIKSISSANIACGFHAGDPDVMAKTVEMAVANGVGVGAHPGFNDLQGFGRRKIEMAKEPLTNELIYQIGAIDGFCKAYQVELAHVKPHGALNNMASVDTSLAEAIVNAIKRVNPNLIFVALAGSEMFRIGKEQNLRMASEVFADRAYNSDGTLVSRKQPGAVLHDFNEVKSRVLKMILEGKVKSIQGEEIDMEVDTICLHGDNPEAVKLAHEIKEVIVKEGIAVKPLNTFIP